MKIKKLDEMAIIPKYQTKGSAGFDIHVIEESTIYPSGTRLLSTGLAFEVPEGYELQIRPRSGLSLNTGLRIANSPGTIDADYRGEVKIIVQNLGFDPISIKVGDRVAQGVVNKIEQVEFEVVDQLSRTDRDGNGFGSTDGNVSKEEGIEGKTEEAGIGE